MVEENDNVILVTPIDSAAPKGRIILPQQQVLRDLLDKGAIATVVKETQLKSALKSLNTRPKLVITDSQAFEKVSQETPYDILLTSFSILFARYKGILDIAVKGVKKLDLLKDGDVILISEGCTDNVMILEPLNFQSGLKIIPEKILISNLHLVELSLKT